MIPASNRRMVVVLLLLLLLVMMVVMLVMVMVGGVMGGRRQHTRVQLGRTTVVGGRAGQQLRHEANVRYRQAQCFDARQPFLVREGGHFAAQLVERFVQVEHAAPFAYVGCAPLCHRGYSAARFLCRPTGRCWLCATWRKPLADETADLLPGPDSCKKRKRNKITGKKFKIRKSNAAALCCVCVCVTFNVSSSHQFPTHVRQWQTLSIAMAVVLKHKAKISIKSAIHTRFFTSSPTVPRMVQRSNEQINAESSSMYNECQTYCMHPFMKNCLKKEPLNAILYSNERVVSGDCVCFFFLFFPAKSMAGEWHEQDRNSSYYQS